MLPAQGPITAFVHHNTLHAFEHQVFEDAVVRAGALFGCEPFMAESFYRGEIDRGRITAEDVDAVLTRGLDPDAGAEVVFDRQTRHALRRRLAIHGIPEARGHALEWLLSETDALARFRTDVPADARESIAATRGEFGRPSEERDAVRELWSACELAIARAGAPRRSSPRIEHRHRDLILARCGVDIDDWIHPILIRFVSAYLDQGLAQWRMPGRERGMYACFLDCFDTALAGLSGEWARSLPGLISAERRAGGDGLESLTGSLTALGLGPGEWREFLSATALALRGFAGMVRQIEERPDRAPAFAVPATLVDFLAVRLVLERVAITHVARSLLEFDGPIAELGHHLRAQTRSMPAPSIAERAWSLFHTAQLCGLDGVALHDLEAETVAAIERELDEFDGLARRELLHLAYEHHIRRRFYDAVIQHEPTPTPSEPSFQAIFCLDDREESIRRHIEELEPRAETIGAAGFFGVAMYFRGAEDARPRPLCPVAIAPQHDVTETLIEANSVRARVRQWRRRGIGLVDKNIHLGSRTLVRGAIVMAALGTLSLIPLVLRVVFPWLRPRVAQLAFEPATRLELDRDEASSISDLATARFTGFTLAEKLEIVSAQLDSSGLTGRLAALVFVVGHGSFSLNNPHASAYDCGACGGGRGGSNGRAFAQMANDPEVRELLAARGRAIPAGTWFVGAFRNTTDSSVTFYDLDRVPESHQSQLADARAVFEKARRRDAHERARRFELARLDWSSQAALRHVEARSADLAQPRAECGHATNAVCFVGRRSRVRGLFLDRRAFLTSYDPSTDQTGEVLAGTLAAVSPVVAGINLEYYFSHVDPRGYGSGTKLPHNVISLLGVMDGAQSDLRTGLPWQMVEIHEPVRLTMMVESDPDRLAAIIAGNPSLARLVTNRWMILACLDPRSQAVWEYGPDGFEPRTVERALAIVQGNSRTVYHGKRGHLPFTRIAPPTRKEQS